MPELATESGHWYEAETGAPKYTLIGKNGVVRPTTLRDARKLALFPSVTTVMGILAKPGLEWWKNSQGIAAAYAQPPMGGETEKAFSSRIRRAMAAKGNEAAEEGSRIHGALELAQQCSPYPKAYARHVRGVGALMKEHFPPGAWQAEKSFAHPAGFGGKVDLFSRTVVVDYKSKDFTEATKLHYPEMVIQLAAYRKGLAEKKLCAADATLANVFVSRNKPGLTAIHIWDEDEGKWGEDAFMKTLALWQQTKKYWPVAA